MSAVAHEIRNLSGAVLVVHKNLSRMKGLEANEDFEALGSLIQSLERVSALELGSATAQNGEAVELTSVLEELRILIEATYHESNISVHWDVPVRLPLVWADRYGLVQVFLNLARNSERALASSETKQLRISAAEAKGRVVIRFEDRVLESRLRRSSFSLSSRALKRADWDSMFRAQLCVALAETFAMNRGQPAAALLSSCPQWLLPRRK